MYPRLYIARELLRDDGVIFISIDDNEQAQLKILCDEVFGEENFVGSFIWNNKYTVSNDTDISYQHEHILCYSKSRTIFSLNLLERTEK
ncbi:DNA methyltransferase [Pasteurella bettyae]|uniref:DNA (Cytosine-5-)-methyltransferase domain protein n=2 Tax=Pasteurella bettyae TaxID=752 RepID=I3DIR2_9PAST|nr:DNA (cytosine-5-)-methyltransferase domain protein [Pasteurella bettyae CCUG 2042]SUB21725.1 type III restriction-modification system EcoP15I [Pasteurella bettyae]